jgi:MoxR-like ATPase
MIALITGGHILLEGVPGLAKTTASRPWRMRWAAVSSASPSRRICCPPM